MSRVIAGHKFDSGPLGNHCSNVKGEGKVCNKALVDILGATADDVGKYDWACSGTLSRTEYEEIVKERERIYGALGYVVKP